VHVRYVEPWSGVEEVVPFGTLAGVAVVPFATTFTGNIPDVEGWPPCVRPGEDESYGLLARAAPRGDSV